MRLQPLILAILLSACADERPPANKLVVIHVPGRSLVLDVEGAGADTFLVVGAVPLPRGYLVRLTEGLARHGAVLRWIPDGESMGQDLTDLTAIADSLQLSRPVLVGHQSGALLALRYATLRPLRTRSLVAISPLYIVAGWNHTAAFLPYDTGRRAAFLDALKQGRDTLEPAAFCTEWWGLLFAPREVGEPTQSELAPSICPALPAHRFGLERRRQQLRDLENWDDRPLADSLRVPLLVIEGTADPFADSAAADWTRRGAGTLRLLGGPGFAPWLGGAVPDSVIAFLHRLPSAVAESAAPAKK